MKKHHAFLCLLLTATVCLQAESRWSWSVVVSELMVDPSPSVGLPEVEYVEIYNRSDSIIPLNGWTIRVGSKIGRLNSDTLPPHTYALLCSHTKSDSLSRFGKVVGVTAWPSLNNDGCSPMLCDEKGEAVAWTHYQRLWIDDAEEREGGWSWECRDVENVGGQRDNWGIANAPQGGTPGTINSIAVRRPDTLIPRVARVAIPNDTTLMVCFNKTMRQSEMTTTGNYLIAGHTISAIMSLAPKDGISLTMTPPLNDKEEVVLSISNLHCQTGLTLKDTTVTFLTPTTLYARCLVINEVMYQCSRQSEWFELFNPSDESFLLSDCRVAVVNGNGKSSAVQPLCEEALTLQPGSFAVVSKRPDATLNAAPPEALLLTCQLPALPDDGGCIVVMSSDSTVIDEVCYSPEWHHALLAEGHEVSLERIEAEGESNDGSNWQSAAASESYSTPGHANSARHREGDDTKERFMLDYDTFTPNGDGYHDKLQIRYAMPSDGFVLNATVYDPSGIPRHVLARQFSLSTEGVVRWDGKENGTLLPRGIYVILLEAFHPSGMRIREKVTCVLS